MAREQERRFDCQDNLEGQDGRGRLELRHKEHFSNESGQALFQARLRFLNHSMPARALSVSVYCVLLAIVESRIWSILRVCGQPYLVTLNCCVQGLRLRPAPEMRSQIWRSVWFVNVSRSCSRTVPLIIFEGAPIQTFAGYNGADRVLLFSVLGPAIHARCA